MKINRFVALALIAVLAVAAMGAISTYVAAQGTEPPTPSQDCDAEDDDAAEAAEAGPDTDAIEEEVECGHQDSDADDVEEEFEAETEDSPTGTPAITAEEAQRAAEAYLGSGTASGAELESENGQLVYGVEIEGTEVTIDAMTGGVLGVEVDGD